MQSNNPAFDQNTYILVFAAIINVMRWVVCYFTGYMAGLFFGPLGKVAQDVLENTVLNHCTFENDTKYKVFIVDHDGTRTLEPGRSQGIVWYIICFALGNTILKIKLILTSRRSS